MTTLESIAAAIEGNDPDLLDELVGAVCVSVADHPLAELDAVCEYLKHARQFDALGRVADAAIQQGHDGRMWGYLVQSLLDRGISTAAQASIDAALQRNRLSPTERAELLGQAGRISKERYVRTDDPAHLHQAIALYTQGVFAGGDRLWLGVNAHALAHRGRRRGVDVAPLEIESERDLMKGARAKAESGDHWAIATLVEASLLVGLPVPVDTIVTQLADADTFLLASLRRQLREVWDRGDDHPAVMQLAEFALRQGAGEIEVAAGSFEKMQGTIEGTSGSFEKMWGPEKPIPLDNYHKGITAAGSVCSLLDPTGQHLGTGFALDGQHLHQQLAGRRVLVTNEHVVPMSGGVAVRPETLRASFTAHDTEPVSGFTGVWWSARNDLDIALLVSEQLDRSAVSSLQPARAEPAVYDGAYVYVVGHPGGGGLQLSIRGNDLIDTDGIRLHYRAPTKPGSSGSPVFDEAWQLVGVHHYGSDNLSALRHQTGRYKGNQGTMLSAITARLSTEHLDLGSATG